MTPTPATSVPATPARAPRPRIVCVGHSALDLLFAVDSWPQGSAKIAASRFEEGGGGMAANAAASIVRLGGEALFCGPLGEDALADTIQAQLRSDGVDISGMRRFPGLDSSVSAVLLDAHGERLVVGYRGSALSAPADWLPLDRIVQAQAVLVDVRWPNGASAALQAARAAGIPAILDGEIAPRETLETLSVLADHVLFSERGMGSFSPTDAEAGLKRVIAQGSRLAAVTRGAHGLLWLVAGSDRIEHMPAFVVETVDTLAAGDVFHGAYALALARRQSVPQALRFASAAAAIKCSRPGGRSGAPSLEEVERFLAQDPSIDLSKDSP